jgi:hypothetical protein
LAITRTHRNGRRAVELLPVTKDPAIGYVAKELGSDLCVDGEKDHAFEPLSTAAKLLGVLSYGELRLHSNWDPLRSDPRFEKIVASLGPNSQWKILKRVLLQVAPR